MVRISANALSKLSWRNGEVGNIHTGALDWHRLAA
jgi:hypothetical protein